MTAATITDVEKIRRLPWMITANVLNTVMVTFTFAGSVFILFLDELGLDNAQIGFMLSLVPFCGIIAPFVAPAVTRFGYKRVFVAFWGIRSVVMALLLFTPLVLATFGLNSAFVWVAGVILVFSICRAIAETGGYPWRKEVVPDAMRGKFSAVNSISTTIAGIIVTVAAGYIIDLYTGLGRFMFLIGVGVTVGLLSAGAYARVPGEGPRAKTGAEAGHLKGMKQALRDKNFMLFLLSLGLGAIDGIVISFIPLYMKQQIGLTEGIIVLLSIGTYIGSLLTSYLWGWTADRYGSKPVMQSSLYIMLVLPFAWFLLPRNSEASAPLAMAIAFLVGVATLAWQISWTRYLFVNATPGDNKAPYMAVFYAWLGLVSGLGPLLAGQILNLAQNINAQIWLFTFDPFTPLFIIGGVMLVAGSRVVARLETDQETTFRRFAGMFLRGNPIRALTNLIQYNLAGDEMTRIVTTERLADTHSLLSTNELIEALSDPSFNVRYEAIHAIGRMPSEPVLIDALVAVLQDGESELGMAASRSLGKMADKRAIEPLRQALHSEYRLVQANSARALAMLEDEESIPIFLERFKTETNPTIRMGYVSALGRLRVKNAIDGLFDFLREIDSPVWRGEIGLALARIIGDERYYLQHWRSMQTNQGTATAQAVLALQKPIQNIGLKGCAETVEQCGNAFARDEIDKAANHLAGLLNQLPQKKLDSTLAHALQICARNLSEFGGTRFELILLSLHIIDTALSQLQSNSTS